MMQLGTRKLRRLMHWTAASLTSALLVAHLVLGCCWHHAHACDSPWMTSHTGPPVAASSHSACNGKSGHHQRHESQHHGDHACEGAACSAVLSTGVNLIRLVTAAGDALAPAAANEAPVIRPAALLHSFRPAPGALRRHLALAVLLI